jgi:transposase
MRSLGCACDLPTAFNRILQLPGASVHTVTFTDQGIVIGLRRRRRLRCPCGTTTRVRYDSSRRRWRHLDFGAREVWLQADIHRIDCRACRQVRTEQVPWARPNARHSSDFENVAAWLAQRMDKTSIGRLLRCPWEAVDAIVARVVVDHIDDARLGHLYRIGVDEFSYKRGRKFLTIVADHHTGNVVWVGKQRSKAAFEEFFTALGPQRAAAIEAISLDGSSVYLPVTREQIPHLGKSASRGHAEENVRSNLIDEFGRRSSIAIRFREFIADSGVVTTGGSGMRVLRGLGDGTEPAR